jgi:hypothetical protein
MKTLPKIEISDELSSQIKQCIELSGLCKADVVRRALRIGLPQLAARFQPSSLMLEDHVREALAERAEPVSPVQFARKMKAMAHRPG